MRIGELERRTGVSQRLLRYYEDQGLLRPRRLSSGYRQYDETDVATVANIRNLLAAGLSTATIADLLPCMGTAGGRLIADCPELLLDLYRERDRITSAITRLSTALQTLEGVIDTAPPSTRQAVLDLRVAD
ncbi:MerR family transcriptional regulator [Streptosporangium sp. NPDC050855]|uniref:MerR family transcriptional regulator n=1 Tax=Streptosporangium sp. NPDC050855 TaxID=3366194 RepID=UPI0037AB1A6D